MELKNQILIYFNVLTRNDRIYRQEEFTRIRLSKNPDGSAYEYSLLDKLNSKMYYREFLRGTRTLSPERSLTFSPDVYGELGHPDVYDINLSRVSHLVKNVRIVNNYLIADIKVLDTPQGKELKRMLDDGTQFVFRPRSTGTVNDNKEVTIEHLFTFDAILSTEDAFIDVQESFESIHVGLSKMGTGPGAMKIVKNSTYGTYTEPFEFDKPRVKVEIDAHDGCDKNFLVTVNKGALNLYVDYDDVNHAKVDASVRVLKDILEAHWSEYLFKKYYREELKKEWDENEDIREEYTDFESFFDSRL
jgi:hypothetical protein